ncbi:MAG: hypothetical protein ABI950_00380 [Solirubrobacteraceae bacterium]
MTLRRFALALVLTVVAGGAMGTASAPAVTRHCSASGDVCFGAFGTGHATKLRITLAAKYFNRYTLCVRSPGGTSDCHQFGIFSIGNGLFGSTVTWAAHFPARGRGIYRATWNYGGGPVAPSIAFRVGPSIRATPSSVAAGDIVRVAGLAGGCPAGSRVTLISRAFSHAHDFAGVSAVYATVRTGDTYAVRTRIPAGRNPGTYSITARCGGGNFGVSAQLRVR